MDADKFFKTLFHDKPEGDYILIWEKHEKQKLSYWFKDTSQASNHFRKQGLLQDTYVGCGTSSKERTKYERCKAKEIAGIPAAWIDVDVLDPAHKKPNLPETDKDAIKIIDSFPLKPTIIIHSGHGFQCWWVFDKFIHFKSDEHREEVGNVIHAFTWSMRDYSRSLGYDLDMTFDLSRVFRIPGGNNYKYPPPVPVKMSYYNDTFYSLKDFKKAINDYREWLGKHATSIEKPQEKTKTTSLSFDDIQFVMDPNAKAPEEKFEALMTFEPLFKATWEMKRKGFHKGDDSPSAYDLSLASFAFHADWEPQEVVNLLIEFRRVNKLQPKLVFSYFKRTLITASNVLEQKKLYNELNDVHQEIKESLPEKCVTEDDKIKRDEIVAKAQKVISDILQIKIIRIIRYPVNPVEYRLITDKKEIHLGTVKNLIEYRYFRLMVANVGYALPSKIKGDMWDKITDALVKICEDDVSVEDISDAGQVQSWLVRYLQHTEPLYDMDDAQKCHRPFYHGNHFYLFGPEFRQYIGMFCREIVTRKMMGFMLKEYGFNTHRMNFKRDNRYIMRLLWRIEIDKDKTIESFCDRAMLAEAIKIHTKGKEGDDFPDQNEDNVVYL